MKVERIQPGYIGIEFKETMSQVLMDIIDI